VVVRHAAAILFMTDVAASKDEASVTLGGEPSAVFDSKYKPFIE
jgi:hypothetical protein